MQLIDRRLRMIWATLCLAGSLGVTRPTHAALQQSEATHHHGSKNGKHHGGKSLGHQSGTGTLRHSAKPAAEASPPTADPKTHKTPAPVQNAEAVKPVEAVETIEPVEDVTAVEATPTGSDSATPDAAPIHVSLWSRSKQAMGHMHAAVIHLPIAWVMLWFCFELLALYGGQQQLRPAGPWIAAASLLSFIPATVTGLLRYGELAAAAADTQAMDPARLHRNMMYGCMALCFVACVLRLFGEEKMLRHRQSVFIAVLGVTFFAVSFAAHLGGRLVYGDDFLPF